MSETIEQTAIRAAREIGDKTFKFREDIISHAIHQHVDNITTELKQHMELATSLLRHVADIRIAAGDSGKRMQPELVEYCTYPKLSVDKLTKDKQELREMLATLLATITNQEDYDAVTALLESTK